MARRRLHGETQKRRKKKQTRTLKQSASVTRVQATQRPADFEVQGELQEQDITFLEAMRDMGVRRIRRAGEGEVRIEKFEQVHIATDNAQAQLFSRAMESLGVTPLGTGRRSRPGAPSGGRGGNPAPVRPSPVNAGPGDRGKSPDPPHPSSPARPGASPPRGGHDRPGGGGKDAFTHFDLEGDQETLMEDWLEQGPFDPAAKFEGAPPPPPSRAESRGTPDSPDAELDLHGKTLEEALRMVGNFLQTSHRRKLRILLIITGKGHHSGATGPVLREAVFRWLERNGAPMIRFLGWAPPRHGGDGAIWVELK